MKVPTHHLSLAAALTLLSFGAMSAEQEPLKLTEAESADLADIACQSRHGVGIDRIDGQAYGRGAQASANAEVRCASHGQLKDGPMHYVAQCFREQGRWRCQGEWNEMLVAAGVEPIVVRAEGKMLPQQAHDAVLKIARSGEFQGQQLREVMASPCYVHRGRDEFIDIKCRGWHITASLWCPQTECPRVISLTKTVE
jgi:hypothetical protein